MHSKKDIFDHGWHLKEDDLEGLKRGYASREDQESRAENIVTSHPGHARELKRRLLKPETGPRNNPMSRLIWKQSRSWALSVYGRTKKRDRVSLAVRLLTDQDREVSGLAFRLLEGWRPARSIPALAGCLADNRALPPLAAIARAHPSQRIRIARCLLKELNRRFRDWLARPGEINPRSLVPVLKALRPLSCTDAIPLLRQILERDSLDRHVRQEAASALGKIPDPGVIEPLLSVARSDPEHSGARALEALAELLESDSNMFSAEHRHRLNRMRESKE